MFEIEQRTRHQLSGTHVHPAMAAVASGNAIRRAESQSASGDFDQAWVYPDAGGVGALGAGEDRGAVYGFGGDGVAAMV